MGTEVVSLPGKIQRLGLGTCSKTLLALQEKSGHLALGPDIYLHTQEVLECEFLQASVTNLLPRRFHKEAQKQNNRGKGLWLPRLETVSYLLITAQLMPKAARGWHNKVSGLQTPHLSKPGSVSRLCLTALEMAGKLRLSFQVQYRVCLVTRLRGTLCP